MRYAFVSISLVFAVSGAGCGGEAGPSDGKPVVFASVLPVADVVSQLAGEAAHVESVVEPGHSPATYSISPRRMQAIGSAAVFLRVGVPFENRLVDRLRNRFPELTIVDLRQGIDLLEMVDHGHGEAGHDHGHGEAGHDHGHGEADPHVWLDPVRMKTMARTAAESLTEALPDAASSIEENLDATLASLDSLNLDMASTLQAVKGETMYAFHPAYGYLADRYGLKQKAIQKAGKGPGIRSLQALIDEMRSEGVEVIFVQSQFSTDEAEAAAEAVGAELAELDPLPRDYQEGMRRLAQAIRDALAGRGAP